jgi:hypothetical protein
MKKALFVLFYSLMSVMLYGQGFAVSADKMNVAYAGVDNSLMIVAEGCGCDQIIASCDNGTLKKFQNCEYIYKPETLGKHNINVKIKTVKGLKDLGTVVYRVKAIPDPIVSLGRSGHFAKLNRLGPEVRLKEFDFKAKFIVKDFTFEVKRKNEIIHSVFNEGQLYSGKVKAIIDKLYPGDIITVTNVHCVGPDNRIRKINDVSYTLE